MLGKHTSGKDPKMDDLEIHRNAYNAAFYELGLKWHWDSDTFRSLLPKNNEKERIQFYLENYHAHLLSAYDAEFLVEAIESAKNRCYNNMTNGENLGKEAIDWAEIHSAEIGV